METLTRNEEKRINDIITDRLRVWSLQGLFPGLGPFEKPMRGKDRITRTVGATPDTVGDADYVLENRTLAVLVSNLPKASTQKLLIFINNYAECAWNIEPFAGDSIGLTGSLKIVGPSEYLVIQGDGGTNWNVVGRGFRDGPFDPASSGKATLAGGVVTVLTVKAKAGMNCQLTPLDVNSLGTPRVDNIVAGVSFDINSTGATDDGVVGWLILP